MGQQRVQPRVTSGFPEWTPQVRMVELQWLDTIRTTLESHGFCSIETPAVETLDALMSKGETSQEVYTLRRLQADPDDNSDARVGLHFDLTVPFARYAATHFNELVFPFKRYQIQPAWRGERPQEGRYRQFTQADLDVINPEHCPLSFDAELPRIAHEILTRLDLPAWTLRINNRKILQGFYQGLDIPDPLATIQVMDKADKLTPEEIHDRLVTGLQLSSYQAKACQELAAIQGTDLRVIDQIRGLGVADDLLSEGLDELGFVLDQLSDLPDGILADLSVARGLDYYTGTVYEAKFLDWPTYPSICGGGRYDDLAFSFIRQPLPGVGLSIGVTRIFAKLVNEGLIATGPHSPTHVLVVLPSEDKRRDAAATARLLRGRGINTELYHNPDKIGKQLRYATRKGIRHVWFPPFDSGATHEVKNLDTGDQNTADPHTWQPT